MRQVVYLLLNVMTRLTSKMYPHIALVRFKMGRCGQLIHLEQVTGLPSLINFQHYPASGKSNLRGEGLDCMNERRPQLYWMYRILAMVQVAKSPVLVKVLRSRRKQANKPELYDFFSLPFLPAFLLSDLSCLSFLHRLAFMTETWLPGGLNY